MANPYNPSLMPRTYFRAPRVPFDFRAVLFAALGYLVWWAGDAALSGIFDKQSVSSAFLVWLYRLFEGIPYLGGGLRLALSGVFHMDVGNAMTGGYTFWHELVGGLWFVGVWSFVTLGVARIVALRIARDEGLSIGETIRFSLKNWTSLLFVPLIIGGLIALFVGCNALAKRFSPCFVSSELSPVKPRISCKPASGDVVSPWTAISSRMNSGSNVPVRCCRSCSD